jgi:thioester reductase-like protein
LRARGYRLLCLVRAPDRVAANQRLAEALHARRIPVEVGVDVQAIPADLAAPDLGLAPADRAALDAIGAVVHAGATVSWLAPYAALRGPNVRGTVALLELAAGRPFHHVSTISTTHPGGDETSTLPFEHALAAGPYGLTKWIAEQHVKRAAAVAGVPVAIYRPAMIAGHTARGLGNADDFLCRYMAGCAELGRFIDRDDAIIDMTPVDVVAAAIAALVDGRPADGSLYHLANVDQSLTFAGLGRAMIAAGLPLAPASYDEFRTALHARPVSRLHALAAFLAPTFALGMGPWPCTRTLAALAPLGITRPRIDDAIIARYVAAL